jgi:hypothetical protein
MHRSSSRHRLLIAGIVLTMSMSACAKMEDWLQTVRTPAEERVIPGAPKAEEYIREMYLLASGDPATQAEIFADSYAAATLTPDPSSKLRLALVLAAPGHAESDPERAQDMLRELLAQTEMLTPAEVSLATIHLYEIEERLKLGYQAERLQNERSRAASSEQQAIEQRIALVEAQNRELRQSLEEAEQKLEAITNIERSIREQTDNRSSNLP